jgi:23S rRNA pseudouridine1911/1915/1917 synthase
VNGSLVVLYEDSDCLAVVKPAGQFTQGTWAPPDELTLEQSVRAYLDPLNPESVFVGIVHRLDRPTSGVLIWAKTVKAARRLSSQFERRQVSKEYWAIVESSQPSETVLPAIDEPRDSAEADLAKSRNGRLSTEEIWSDWLTRADRSGVVHVVDTGTAGARIAVTTVQRGSAVQLPEGCQWLRLRPTTGRTHQLRVQAARRGTPILGDTIYGSTSTIFTPNAMIALHARCLALKHPILRHEMTLVAPVPEVWRSRGIVLQESND